MVNPRNRVQPLPPLPVEEIAAAAADWVDQRLAGLRDPAETVKRASALMEDQREPFARARIRRDQVAMSIREYGPDATEPVPVRLRNVRLAEAAGISRPRLQTIRNAWADEDLGPVPLIINARRELAEAARQAAMCEAIINYARDRRDEAVAVLIDKGWTNAQLAEVMGRHRTRASAHRRRAAARGSKKQLAS